MATLSPRSLYGGRDTFMNAIHAAVDLAWHEKFSRHENETRAWLRSHGIDPDDRDAIGARIREKFGRWKRLIVRRSAPEYWIENDALAGDVKLHVEWRAELLVVDADALCFAGPIPAEFAGPESENVHSTGE